MFVVITGFAALTIDAGVSYDQSRNDQDVSDSASLAASYAIFQGDSLSTAYSAAQYVATLDCNGPSSSCPVSVTFYTGTSGATYPSGASVLCTETSGGGCTGDSTTNVKWIGTSISNTASDYFANLGQSQSRIHTIASQAVASVYAAGSSGGGGTTTNPQAACEICVFGNVTSTAGNNVIEAAGGSIDIAGYVDFENSPNTIETTNGYGIDIIGANQHNGYTVYTDASNNTIDASGVLGIDGSAFSYSTTNVLETGLNAKADINVSGTTDDWGQTPAAGNNATPSFTDPLAAVTTPTYTGATTSCGSVTVGNGSTSSSGCLTVNGSTRTLSSGIYGSVDLQVPTTVNPGEYTSMTTQSTVTFNPGIYVFTGSGIVTDTGSVLDGTSVSFYFTCGNGTPTSCGTWSSSGTPPVYSCSTQSKGAGFEFTGSTALDLSAGGTDDNILFFYDRCNDNAQAYFVNGTAVTADSGYPSGIIYGHSGTLETTSPTTALPSPLLFGNVFFNTGSCTVGTSSGSEPLTATTPSSPGNLVS
jgi:hypothetical protein